MHPVRYLLRFISNFSKMLRLCILLLPMAKCSDLMVVVGFVFAIIFTYRDRMPTVNISSHNLDVKRLKINIVNSVHVGTTLSASLALRSIPMYPSDHSTFKMFRNTETEFPYVHEFNSSFSWAENRKSALFNKNILQDCVSNILWRVHLWIDRTAIYSQNCRS